MVTFVVDFTLVDNSTKCKSKLDVEMTSVPSGYPLYYSVAINQNQSINHQANNNLSSIPVTHLSIAGYIIRQNILIGWISQPVRLPTIYNTKLGHTYHFVYRVWASGACK